MQLRKIMDSDKITKLFVDIDDFYKIFEISCQACAAAIGDFLSNHPLAYRTFLLGRKQDISTWA
jgi:hypothetical protein